MELRQVIVSSYTVPIRNDQRVVRFKEGSCDCGQDLTTSMPTTPPKAIGPGAIGGECPGCGHVRPMHIPDHIESIYDTKDSMVEILLSAQNQISGTELLERDKIARKILDCADGHILLEEEEWSRLVKSVNTVKGLGKPEVELVRRVLGAETVEVEEKK